MPPMVTVVPPSSNRTATSLFFVSVVIMALDAPVPLSRLPSSKGAMALTPAVILSMGSCMPMTPVDATRTLFSRYSPGPGPLPLLSVRSTPCLPLRYRHWQCLRL